MVLEFRALGLILGLELSKLRAANPGFGQRLSAAGKMVSGSWVLRCHREF